MDQTYNLTGMHCEMCVSKISKALTSVPNVTSVKVTLDPPEAYIGMSEHVSLETLNNAIKGMGNYTLGEKAEPLSTSATDAPQSLKPLFIIVGYIVGGAVLRALFSENYSLHSLMTNFMGGFFVLFSLFKMIDLGGFADGYSTYDIIAKRSRRYAISYPFIELVLGILYFWGFFPLGTNILTIFFMAIGSVGVLKALREKRAIQCACLGTALKLPMTKVTLGEDLLMGIMALMMLLA